MFTRFSSLQKADLSIIRNGWFRRSYELTDGKSVYGKLTYYGFFRRKALVETAEVSWKFQFKTFFSRTILISETSGLQVGELQLKWFSSAAFLRLTDGSVYKFSRPSFWGRKYIWTDDQQKELLTFRSRLLSKTVFEISLAKNSMQNPLLLLSFVGAHVMLSKRRKKAAAH